MSMYALAREPGTTASYPWKFTLGQNVYAQGRIDATSLKVIGGELHLGYPHLHVVDAYGHQWRIPQIHCTAKASFT
jgi:hypothetical protein